MDKSKFFSDEMVEKAAAAIYESVDQYGRSPQVTWVEMLTYGGEFPDNTDHPIADNFRTMARAALKAAIPDTKAYYDARNRVLEADSDQEALEAECKAYGLPVSLRGLLRHIYGNAAATFGALYH